jgi:hypothetical protein
MTEPSGQPTVPPGGDADGADFDTRAAAALIDRTDASARRQLQPRAPLFIAICGVLVFAAYGSLWLSVRDQHPYVGPSLAAIGVVYGLVVVCAVAGAMLYRRARSGVTGRSRREERIFGLALLPGIVGVYTFAGALKFDGFGPALTVGVFDAAGPWLIVGTALVAFGAAREDWWRVAGGVGVVAVAVTAAFAGADNVWGVLAVGALVLFLASSMVNVLRGRSPLA